MILQSFFMYGVLCAVPLIYGIGLKELSAAPKRPLYIIAAAVKSLCTVFITVFLTRFLTVKLLTPYSLAVLYPFFALPLTFAFSLLFKRFIYICCKIETAEFDIAFLSVILAVSEGFTLMHALIIGAVSTLSFYILLPVLGAVRKRLEITRIHPAFNDTVMIIITLALITCGLYGWNLSWLNTGLFKGNL
ncbi:MAG: hypothetical protein ACTTKC_09920 [Treponema sp.]|uniref:hypothetical protein n=1 Tax=Treponema sp. TaxID=166 RepID=UPI003FA1AB8F